MQQLSFSLISLENIPSSTTVLHAVQRLSLEGEKLILLDCGHRVCTDIDAFPAPWARSLWGAVSKRNTGWQSFPLAVSVQLWPLLDSGQLIYSVYDAKGPWVQKFSSIQLEPVVHLIPSYGHH